MKNKLNIGLIGTRFMGKAHSYAWKTAQNFFDVPYTPVLKAVSAQDINTTEKFANNWEFETFESDWRKVVDNPDIDVIDVCTPTAFHHEIVMAAAAAGKHVFCEKPCALNAAQSKEMAEAADKAGVVHYLNHNYRRVPAITFAKQLIDEGKIGEIYHWRGTYLQDWIMDPNFPLTWQLKKETAGAGPQYDLNSHSVDLARYLIGEIDSVMAILKTFTKQRPLPAADATAFKSGKSKESENLGDVTVDDAAFMLANFNNGTMGSFEASRFAGGRKNYNYFEIYGSKGSLTFNLEQMNELMYCNFDDPENVQGFRNINVSLGSHPYMANWWAPAHIIGYGNTFVHAVVDFLKAVKDGGTIKPNLWDGYEIMRVLEAGILSSKEGRMVNISEI